MFAAVSVATALSIPTLAQAGGLEKKSISIAVAGSIGQMNKVPYALALSKKFFEEEGLTVKSTAFASGSKAMQSLVADDSEVAEGAYEHTILLQKRGVHLKCLITFGRYPGNVLVVNKAEADKIKTPKDLRGKKIGVSAPGSSTYDFAAMVLQRAGVPWKSAHYVSVGTGMSAVAAMKNGSELDALVNLDPAITNVVNSGKAVIMVDSRTEKGTHQAFGGDYLSDCLMAKASFIEKNPKTSQAFVNAVVHAMKWLRTASIDDIIKSLPPSYYSANEAEYRESLKNNIAAFKWNGVVTTAAAQRVLDTIMLANPNLKSGGGINLAATFDNKFVNAANKKFKN
jgi:NitT/TauT family transport system substrate-binding protein